MTHAIRLLAVLLTVLAPAAWAQGAGAPVFGDWDGAVKVPAGLELPLILHFTQAGATLDSPDQKAAGLPVTVTRDGNTITLDLPSVRARFDGVLSSDGQTLAGPFTQGGQTMSARFTRRAPGAAAPVRDRPQTPKPPYPYAVREVSLVGSPGVVLAGTLTQPTGPGPFPAVVMIAGSGPQNRDEAVEGHKIFAVIADRLTRAGIAVLRYDKRGVGGSTGHFADATGADFADDAQAAADWLVDQPGIAPGKVGLVGHSEGAEIAPIVADRDPHIAFVVLLAAPAITGAETIASQQKAILLASGMPEARAERLNAVERRLLEAARKAPDAESAQVAVRTVLLDAGAPPEAADAQSKEVGSPWFLAFLDDDPAPALRLLRQPTLVVAGSKDLQVLPDLNLPVIRAALAENKDAKIVELDGLNHLLQPATTGAPSEYGTISTTIAPAALDLITDWVVKQGR